MNTYNESPAEKQTRELQEEYRRGLIAILTEEGCNIIHINNEYLSAEVFEEATQHIKKHLIEGFDITKMVTHHVLTQTQIRANDKNFATELLKEVSLSRHVVREYHESIPFVYYRASKKANINM